jgi:hypothetical protein
MRLRATVTMILRRVRLTDADNWAMASRKLDVKFVWAVILSRIYLKGQNLAKSNIQSLDHPFHV